MKFIFYFLVLANVGYFVYLTQFWQAPQPRTRVELEQTGERLVLLQDVQEQVVRKPSLTEVMDNPLRRRADMQSDCRAAGPFSDIFKAQDLVERLGAMDINSRLKAVDTEVGSGDFRVIIPRAASAEDAFRKLRELKARNIDSYVITQGEQSLAISLGVFSSNEAALKLANELSARGYQTEILPIPRVLREYWVFSAVTLDLNVPSEIWAGIVENWPGLEIRPIQCIDS